MSLGAMVMTLINVLVVLGGALGLSLVAVALLRRRPGRLTRALCSFVILAAWVCALGAAATELFAGLGRDQPIVLKRDFFQEYRPGQFAFIPHGRWIFPMPGWKSTEVVTNADGLRSAYDLPDLEKMGPKKRVLFVGDSFTFGLGLEAAESYPADAERLLDAPSDRPADRPPAAPPWVAINAGVPGSNVFSALSLLDWLADRYRPDVAVVTVHWLVDIKPDLSDELRRRESEALAGLSRFALYRFIKAGRSQLRYRGALFADGKNEIDVRQDRLPRQEQQVDAAVEQLAAVIRRTGCRVVFHVLVPRLPPWPQAQLIERSVYGKFQKAGAELVFTEFHYGEPGLTIPGDGHPTADGAFYLAKKIVPAIERAARP